MNKIKNTIENSNPKNQCAFEMMIKIFLVRKSQKYQIVEEIII